MAGIFVAPMIRDYVPWMPRHGAGIALRALGIALDQCTESHPHDVPKYRSPRGFRQHASAPTQA